MFKSSRKKLIAAGCSFTEHSLSSIHSPHVDWDFTRWPEHLSNMLDMECVNVGRSGAGNDQILARTLDATLNEKDIGLVVIMWSEWRRMGFQGFADHQRWSPITPYDIQKWKVFFMEQQNPLHATRTALRSFIHAEKLLDDTPYMFIQGTQTIWWNESSFETNKKRRHQASNEILKSPYLDYIENNISDKFIGWPLMSEIGGYVIDDIVDQEDPTRLKYRISEDDTHPNAAGHKFIAEFLYEQYKEIYNEN